MKLSRRTIGNGLAALAMIAGLAPHPAQAAEVRWLRLDHSHALYDAIVGAQFRDMGLDAATHSKVAQSVLIFGERLGVMAKGSVLHPRFLTFNGSVSLLALQQSRSGYLVTSTDMTNTFRAEYRATATVKKDSSTPLMLTADRTTDIIRRDFVPNYDLLRTSHTANWLWQNSIAPINLGIAKTSMEYGQGDPGYGADDLIQATASARAKQPSSDAALEYRLLDYTNLQRSWLTYRSHDAMASYIWRSDPCTPRRYQFDSSLRYLDRTSGSSMAQWLGDAMGTVWWSDPLTMRLGYRLLHQDTGASTVLQHTGWTDVRYRFYRSLTLGASAQGGSRSVSGSDRLFGSVSSEVGYVKKLGSFGTTNQLWQQTYYTEKGDNLGGLRQVTGEPHILSSTEPAVLQYEKVLRSSLKVYDAATLKQYVETQDYVVFETGQRLTLRRAVGSTMPDGTAVRVDYQYEEPIGVGLSWYDNRWVGRHSLPIGQSVVTYAEVSERWTDRQIAGQGSRTDRFENLQLGVTGRWRVLDATIEGRRWRAMDFRVYELSAQLGLTESLGQLRATLGNRALVQWMGNETWYNYETYLDGTMPITNQSAMGGRFRYLARAGLEGMTQTLDGDAYTWWQWRQIRVRLDYRVQATWRADTATQSHRLFLSVGRPL